MITNLRKNIIDILNRQHNITFRSLVFLKFNTSISGNGLGNKVIFFVFIDDEKEPRFIVKTVRSKTDFDVIRNGYNRLNNLNSLTENSSFKELFPRAISFVENDNEIWSVETFCSGHKTNIYLDIEKIMQRYSELSIHILKQKETTVRIDQNYTNNLIKNFDGEPETIDRLVGYSTSLWKDVYVDLPAIPQHGDFTTDNILIKQDKFKIIDCDTFGLVLVPGFDIFHLLNRGNIDKKKFYLNEYLKKIGAEYTVDQKLFFVYFLHELNIKRDYILKGRNFSSVIDKFQNMIVSYL